MNNYVLYEHVFPNKKRYVGITTDPQRRWEKDGKGYIGNEPMWKAIQKYGWGNIQHNILETGLSRSSAAKKERELIEKFNLTTEGYNQRNGGTTSKSLYFSHVSKMINECAKFPYLHEFVERMRDLSDDERWAAQVNLVDCVIRFEIKEYWDIYSMSDTWLEAQYWYYYISQWVLHPDISILKIDPPKRIWEVRKK